MTAAAQGVASIDRREAAGVAQLGGFPVDAVFWSGRDGMLVALRFDGHLPPAHPTRTRSNPTEQGAIGIRPQMKRDLAGGAHHWKVTDRTREEAVPREAPRRRSVTGRGRRPPPMERLKVTDWLQGLSGLLAVVLAAPALWVAVYTYRDQQELTRAQLEATRLERERYQERFASRVAAWRPLGPEEARPWAAPPMVLQNRSPAPIREIAFVFAVDATEEVSAHRRPFWSLSDVPPCSIYTFNFFNLAGPMAPGRASSRYGGQVELWFTDPAGRWAVGSEGVEPYSDERRSLVPTPELLTIERSYYAEVVKKESAPDCGEGG
ncbi:hypothetical protein [Micromonospora noduli]|uniref:Uncharacterized protein n=1 Tax=Micromonospora noduli TaxID=709876 RepID=A0A328NCL1_9ACTN|nr:hypothetical protein [Micromonospora noduli]RAO03075.1 hypothetical protein LAH08_02085 [Micromonospora noduli]